MTDTPSAATPDALAAKVIPSGTPLPAVLGKDGMTALVSSDPAADHFYTLDMTREGDVWTVTGFRRCSR